MKNNENGFSIVEILIAVVFIAIIGFAGYFVWNRNKNVNTTEAIDTTNSQSVGVKDMDIEDNNQLENPSAVELDSANILISHNNKFSINIPDGWTVTNDTELDYVHAIGLDNMTYSKDGTTEIINEIGLRGGGPTIASFVMQYGSYSDLENYYSASLETGTITTDSGLVGKTYLYTANQDPNEMLVIGSRSYGYRFISGDNIAVITYLKLPTDPDQLTIVENAIKSFKFL